MRKLEQPCIWLVAPGYKMAQVAVDHILGSETPLKVLTLAPS